MTNWKELGKKAFDLSGKFAKQTIQNELTKIEKKKALENLSKPQLIQLAIDKGVGINQAHSRDTIISDIAKCESLTTSDIMEYVTINPPEIEETDIVDKVKYENTYSDRMRKRELLKELTPPQLKKLAQKYCKSDPWSYQKKDPVGEWNEATMIDELESCEILSPADIISYTKKPRKSKSKAESRKSTQPFRNDRMYAQVENILSKYTPRFNKNNQERNVEDQLVSILVNVLGAENIDYQQKNAEGRADIVVGKDIAIEIKMIYNPASQLRNLESQLFHYHDVYSKLFCYIYDPYLKVKPQDIQKFRQSLKRMGVKCQTFIKPTNEQ